MIGSIHDRILLDALTILLLIVVMPCFQVLQPLLRCKSQKTTPIF